MRNKTCFLLAVLLLLASGAPRPARAGASPFAPADADATELMEIAPSPAPDEPIPTDSPEPEAETETETEPQAEEDGAPVPEAELQAEEGAAAIPAAVPEPHEAVVTTFAALRTALSNDNGITSVFFGADITAEAGGIVIHPAKESVTVSGLNPYTPEQTVPYTLTDYSSAALAGTIRIESSGVRELEVRDLNIVGKNFYGPFSVINSTLVSDVTLIFRRVTYNGPQLVHNPLGSARLIDCSVVIHGRNGGSVAQETVETKHLRIEGENTILIDYDSAYSIFWHPGGGSFTLADDARLTLRSPNASAAYGIFYCGTLTNTLNITIGQRAVFDASVSTIVTEDTYATLSGLTVQEGGAFLVTTTGNAGVLGPVLHMKGPITVEPGAVFRLTGYGNSSYPLLQQEQGDITVGQGATFHLIAERAHQALLTLYSSAGNPRRLILQDPASVLLVNPGKTLRAETAAGGLTAASQQAGYWEAVAPSGLDNLPLQRWERSDGALLTLNGAFSTGASGTFTSLTGNDDSPTPPSPATLNLTRVRVLAFGRLALAPDAPPAGATFFSGRTAPGAEVRATLIQGEEKTLLANGVADSEGFFQLPTGSGSAVDAVIFVESSWNYLSATATIPAPGPGELTLSAPDALPFRTAPLSAMPTVAERAATDWQLTVTDSRGGNGGWRLYATLAQELTPARENLPALQGAVIFVASDGSGTTLTPGGQVLIASRTEAGQVHPITWPHNRGLLLAIPPGLAHADVTYSASIRWLLEDAP